MTLSLSAALVLAAWLQAPPAQPVEPQKAIETPSAPRFFLKITGGVLGTAEIRAKQVEVKALVAQLKTDLKLPIHSSPIVANHRVDLVSKETATTALLAALAPVVLADVEVSTEETSWKAIHLLGLNEREPPRALKQVGFLIMAGVPPEDGGAAPPVTEPAVATAAQSLGEEPKDPEKPVLTVIVEAGRVSARVRKQPLVALLNEIASKGRIPFDLRGRPDMTLMDIELRDTPLRDLVVALAHPDLRLVVRRNLVTGEEVVHGIVVGDSSAPPSPGQ